jgi:hypothetical protein
MDYKTAYVPLGGKTPGKYAELLAKELESLGKDGYETFAIVPLTYDTGGTQGLILSARKLAE